MSKMLKRTNLILSPAAPAAILLYGIMFGFAILSYLGWQWQRAHTIVFYCAIAIWASFVIFRRLQRIRVTFNRLDVLFGVFLLWVLGSLVTHWWKGNIQSLEFMPFFFILPYILGRMMGDEDVQLFHRILIGMAASLLLLLPIEYWKNSQPGFLYANSPAPILFEQGHGTMLAGLLFSTALLSLIFRTTLPISPDSISNDFKKRNRRLDYLVLALIVPALIWVASRAPSIAAVMGIFALFLTATFISWKKKTAILVFLGLTALMAFTISFQNKHHKEYFELLLTPPGVALSLATQQKFKLEYGKPILGERICKNIPNSISDRWIHYRTAWEIFRAKPLMGVGANSYGFYSCTGPGWYPHSTILQVLAELGVAGGLLYFALMAAVFWAPLIRNKYETNVFNKANMSWLLAFIVFQFTVSQFVGSYFMSAGLYFAMGLAASYFKGGIRVNRVKA